ncbi:MAG: hypothetical protein ABSD39_03200 [Terriglobales bacterium]|jgi:hypothetical protein
MTDHQTPDQQQTNLAATGKQKKPYQKPAFRYERVFETAALSCGKIAGTSPTCNSARKTS